MYGGWWVILRVQRALSCRLTPGNQHLTLPHPTTASFTVDIYASCYRCRSRETFLVLAANQPLDLWMDVTHGNHVCSSHLKRRRKRMKPCCLLCVEEFTPPHNIFIHELKMNLWVKCTGHYALKYHRLQMVPVWIDTAPLFFKKRQTFYEHRYISR